MSLVICRPPRWEYRSIRRCPCCERRTRHLIALNGWYGADITCCSCARVWNTDGEGWRWLHHRQSAQWKDRRAELARRWREAMDRREATAADYEYIFGNTEEQAA